MALEPSLRQASVWCKPAGRPACMTVAWTPPPHTKELCLALPPRLPPSLLQMPATYLYPPWHEAWAGVSGEGEQNFYPTPTSLNFPFLALKNKRKPIIYGEEWYSSQGREERILPFPCGCICRKKGREEEPLRMPLPPGNRLFLYMSLHFAPNFENFSGHETSKQGRQLPDQGEACMHFAVDSWLVLQKKLPAHHTFYKSGRTPSLSHTHSQEGPDLLPACACLLHCTIMFPKNMGSMA